MKSVRYFFLVTLVTTVSSQQNNDLTANGNGGGLMGAILGFADASFSFPPLGDNNLANTAFGPPLVTMPDQARPPPTNDMTGGTPNALPMSDLPTGPVAADQGQAFPNEPFPDVFPGPGDAQDPTLDSDFIDPTVLFPPDTTNTGGQPDQGQDNQNFVIAFMPSFPKGDKVVNLNTGKTLQESGNTASFPPAEVQPVDSLPPGTKPAAPPILGIPVKLESQLPSNPEETVPDTKPFVPSKPQRPIVSVPVDSLQKPVEVTNSQPAGVSTSIGGQTELPKQGPNKNQVPASWSEIYPNGQKPDKIKTVKAKQAKEIAPLTPVEVMLNHASLVSFGKDRAMRRMLIQQRKDARRKMREQRRQQQANSPDPGQQLPPGNGVRQVAQGNDNSQGTSQLNMNNGNSRSQGMQQRNNQNTVNRRNPDTNRRRNQRISRRNQGNNRRNQGTPQRRWT